MNKKFELLLVFEMMLLLIKKEKDVNQKYFMIGRFDILIDLALHDDRIEFFKND